MTFLKLQIGPTVEYAHPPSLATAIQADPELGRILPFLALPDGAHLSEEDYSYFVCLPDFHTFQTLAEVQRSTARTPRARIYRQTNNRTSLRIRPCLGSRELRSRAAEALMAWVQ